MLIKNRLLKFEKKLDVQGNITQRASLCIHEHHFDSEVMLVLESTKRENNHIPHLLSN